MWPGAFKLVEVDARLRRRYKQRQQQGEEEEQQSSGARVVVSSGHQQHGAPALQEEQEQLQPCLKKQRVVGHTDDVHVAAAPHHPEA